MPPPPATALHGWLQITSHISFLYSIIASYAWRMPLVCRSWEGASFPMEMRGSFKSARH